MQIYINKPNNSLYELCISDINVSVTTEYVKQISKSDNIEVINFTNKFNSKINLSDNTCVKKIFFETGSKFTRNLDSLPQSLEYLEIVRGKFSKTIDNLPLQLKVLIIGNSFNKPVDNLPSSLERLCISGYFNQPIDNLPSSLLYLNLNCGYLKHPINNLPNQLKTLFLDNYKLNIDRLPISLKTLNLTNYYEKINNLPDSITYLNSDVNNLIDFLVEFPKSLEVLELYSYSMYTNQIKLEIILNKLPKSIKYVSIIANNLISFVSSNPNHIFFRDDECRSECNKYKYKILFN